MNGRTRTPAGELARKGFIDASRAAELFNGLPECTDELVDALAAAADPDQALAGLVDLQAADLVGTLQALAEEPWRRRLIAVLGGSQALGQHLIAHPGDLTALQPEPARWSAEQIRADLLAEVGLAERADDGLAELAMAVADDPGAADRLRLANKRHLLRIAGRDLSSTQPTAIVDQIAAELADLADAIMVCALAIARAQTPHAERARLGIVALGKCGAQELNYLSDIDVLFVGEPATDEVGQTEAISIANRIARATARICSAHSAAGTIWQVDAALRPEGNAGPLVRSLEGHRAYYQRWAKNWEFQAMLKARPMAGDPELTRGFLDITTPLVWQVGGRENFMSDVQAMRRRVVSLIPAKDAQSEIKLGAGGLRDVEFSVQALQLVHGRVDERLRHRGTLVSLQALAEHGYVGREDSSALDASYRFERCIEHRVQVAKLRRSHLMPPDEADRRRIARSMGMSEAADLWTRWRRTARDVESRQNKIFYSPLLLTVSKLSDDQIRLSPDAAKDRLKALGFSDPGSALRHIEALTTGSSRAVEIRRQLMPAMIGWLATGPNPDLGLISFRRLSETMGTTPWYLRALRDGGQMAELLATILSSSRYDIAMIERDPAAVQLLAEPDELVPRDRTSLDGSMDAVVRRHDGEKEAIDAVRALRRRELLRLALGDVLGRIDLDALGRGLSDLAGATVGAALAVAVRGEPAGVPPIGVVAMGRWGGAEMSYASDADAMYVVPDDATPAQIAAAIRVVAKAASLLRLPGADPSLELDADLRPEGRDGAMVRTLGGYLSYYDRWSQTWEHQALIRAAYGAGDEDLVRQFLAGIDHLRWPPKGLGADEEMAIRRLKGRMETERIERGTDRRRNLKLGPGGLSDVEWTVQLMQLRHAGTVESLRTPSTMMALDACESEGLMTTDDAAVLRDAWQLASQLRNHTMLVRGRTSDQLPPDPRDLSAVAVQLGRNKGEASLLIDEYERTTRLASKVVDRLFWGHAE
ncbi:bifunctional [glutamine synthetase] adenylyltransferase/[glutamine synthetase]-adenylyl-L-tyrosine phosphorylase [Propionibacterium freudenreichii]|uniref:bifunctional [glutamine synthetase] adenylyltransferase/[glutamine synthetase]-adenylyl-L-tyrosine phosphorylase n=1 Tax=Propionibacterium freudenreichii TaxID=1744 RepID=UPI00254DD960|nr:bifunctional [glutamine synthetase] adenylyltransferase/[glutamine synthetase]-adenylyl-L-tyrosine phosphorylase [Propionibacterium freudenreichii]MDK9645385.1 bifunctional [glutamine synthetase] adenylyltransferase/[glutamine synthetase]-adenylyl-L-tyrosine phosphorylase [Propionibacterium freudenreichii]MDK9665505.1 bifunctional [glutamine synthetase] adenylyltransferase/[glutamine synthetase]-adenylyl-L-tyrosine phosphorylase [Propionibacterium freudenreichii]